MSPGTSTRSGSWASDATIFDRAAADGDVLITADSDFSALLAARGSSGPSVVLVRHVADLPWHEHQVLLMANLPAVLADLQQGAIVSLSPRGWPCDACRSMVGLRPHLFPDGCPSQAEIAHGALSTTWYMSSSAGRGRQTRQYEMSVDGPVNSHDHGRPGGYGSKGWGFESLRALTKPFSRWLFSRKPCG